MGTALSTLQAQRAVMDELLGEDPFATDIYQGVSIPYTPPEYAESVWADLAASYWPSLRKEISGIELALFGDAVDKRTLNEDELNLIDARNDYLSTFEMTRALNRAYQAVYSATVEGPHGGPVLSPEENAAFWDNMDRYAQYQPIPSYIQSRWTVFRDELRQNVQDVAAWIGETAAKATRQAGEALGAGVSGFFSELGIVGSLIVVGGAVVAVKFIL